MGIQFLFRLALRLAPHAIATLALLLLSQWWYWNFPSARRSFDILQVQMARALKIGDADVIMIGDSSCLMGVDAKRLSSLTGLNVQSLCTYATLGPEGFGIILERYLSRARKARLVIVMMHPQPFDRPVVWDQATGALRKWINPATSVIPTQSFPLGAKAKLAAVLQTVIPTDFPAPRWANFYGTFTRMAGWIEAHNGSALESTPLVEKAQTYGGDPKFDLPVSDSFVASLRQFRPPLERYQGKVVIALTPLPGVFASDAALKSHRTIERLLLDELHLPDDAMLEMPPAISDAYFASVPNKGGINMHHPNPTGVSYLTDLIGDHLYKMHVNLLPPAGFAMDRP